MSEQFCVSVIIPFYNAQSHIKTCLDILLEQDFIKPFEIIMVDDASTDNSQNIVKKCKFPNLQLYSLPSNSGPAAARNLGLKKARGEYIFFLDVDDAIATNTLTTLYNFGNETACDLVLGVEKIIENSQNQIAIIFAYPTDQDFRNSDFAEAMRRRFYDPLYTVGLFDLTGRLIKRSIISDNNIFFEEKLRYLEDETFMWDVLGFVHSAKYVRKQLYSYNVHPNVDTALSDGLSHGFQFSNFKLIKSHIQNSLKRHGFSTQELEKIGNQAFIFFIISLLVSYSRSMILGKARSENSVKYRRKIIDDILAEADVSKAIRNYLRSPDESPWIPRAIAWRSHKLLEFACTRRAKEILRIRRKGKV